MRFKKWISRQMNLHTEGGEGKEIVTQRATPADNTRNRVRVCNEIDLCLFNGIVHPTVTTRSGR